MNRELIEKEIDKHHTAAVKAWEDFQLMPSKTAESRALKHLEIAEALELSLTYNAETVKQSNIEDAMRRIKTIAETGVNNPYLETKVYLHKILSEVQKCQR